MPRSVVWKAPGPRFSRRSGAGSVHPLQTLSPSPLQTPPITLPSQMPPQSSCQVPLSTPLQMLPLLNLSSGSTDLRESGNLQLHIRLLKKRKGASCWERASSSLVLRRNHRIRTFLSPPLHINLPGRTVTQDQSS